MAGSLRMRCRRGRHVVSPAAASRRPPAPPSPPFPRQVAFADRILINKVDLVDEAHLSELREALRTINATATCYETNYSK